jgi:hypothetical protein
MFNGSFDTYQEWKWVIVDSIVNHDKKLQSFQNGIFNINFIDQVDYSKPHRFGWDYVYNGIKTLHNEKSDLILDLYVDRTFHWNKGVNTSLGVIPYVKDWCGFIHHTFDTNFSTYNCKQLFEDEVFIESLKKCRGLFTLSEYLKKQIEDELSKKNLSIKVQSMIHPTGTDVMMFDYSSFLSNSDRKIVHIGSWLRNVYSFYRMNLNISYSYKKTAFSKKRILPVKKAILLGKDMNCPDKTFTEDLSNFLRSKGCNDGAQCNVSGNVSGNSCGNWYKEFSDDITKMIGRIEVINTLSDSDYDKLLSQNIVFVNLVDASAVNTLVECIARNTPIIINNHSAIVEILGSGYPLYFSDSYTDLNSLETELNKLLGGTDIYKNASIYISKLTTVKKQISIDSFVKDLTQKILNLNTP